MNKELRDLLEKIQNKKKEARKLLTNEKTEEAKALVKEIKNLEERFDIESQLVENEKDTLGANNNAKPSKGEDLEVKAFKRAISGQPLTEEMKNVLVTSSDEDGGYLVPEKISTEINELRREYKSLKDLVDVVPVGTGKGSIVVEDLSSLQDLIDFDEVSDLAEQQPKFKQVKFSIKSKGAITPISNVLLQDENVGLPQYITRNFVKKAIRTENKDIIKALKEGKSAKAYKDIKSLKTSFNKDLDPALLGSGAGFIMNQDAFDHLDQEVDANGRPLLQPNVVDASKKSLFGLPIFVVSNNELPTTGTTTKKAPLFFGNFVEGLKFFDRRVYEVARSSEAGFTKNQTLLRVIERYDVAQGDKDAYIYGEIDVTEEK